MKPELASWRYPHPASSTLPADLAAWIAEQENICAAATPPPWTPSEDGSEVIASCPCCGRICVCDTFGPPGDDGKENARYHYNSEFIAIARTAFPTALRLLREKAAELDRIRGALRNFVTIREMVAEIKRLRNQRDELTAAIDELGNAMFGDPEAHGGKSWRDSRAEWWQRCKRAVEAAEAAKEESDGHTG